MDKNSGQRKGCPNPDQTFQADFNELPFILIVLKLIEILGNSRPDLIIHDFRDSLPIIPKNCADTNFYVRTCLFLLPDVSYAFSTPPRTLSVLPTPPVDHLKYNRPLPPSLLTSP